MYLLTGTSEGVNHNGSAIRPDRLWVGQRPLDIAAAEVIFKPWYQWLADNEPNT
jgi:hypothetical protein